MSASSLFGMGILSVQAYRKRMYHDPALPALPCYSKKFYPTRLTGIMPTIETEIVTYPLQHLSLVDYVSLFLDMNKLESTFFENTWERQVTNLRRLTYWFDDFVYNKGIVSVVYAKNCVQFQRQKGPYHPAVLQNILENEKPWTPLVMHFESDDSYFILSQSQTAELKWTKVESPSQKMIDEFKKNKSNKEGRWFLTIDSINEVSAEVKDSNILLSSKKPIAFLEYSPRKFNDHLIVIRTRLACTDNNFKGILNYLLFHAIYDTYQKLQENNTGISMGTVIWLFDALNPLVYMAYERKLNNQCFYPPVDASRSEKVFSMEHGQTITGLLDLDKDKSANNDQSGEQLYRRNASRLFNFGNAWRYKRQVQSAIDNTFEIGGKNFSHSERISELYQSCDKDGRTVRGEQNAHGIVCISIFHGSTPSELEQQVRNVISLHG